MADPGALDGADVTDIVEGAVGLPLDDGLVVLTADGRVRMLNPSGRWFWEAVQTGATPEELAAACVEFGGTTPDAARVLVREALESCRRAMADTSDVTDEVVEPGSRGPREPTSTSLAPVKVALDQVYLFGERPVRVRCVDPTLGDLIDLACGRCRTDAEGQGAAWVEIVEAGDDLVVRATGAHLCGGRRLSVDLWSARQTCLMAIAESALQPRQMLAILHASAVATQGCVVAFAGGRGAGKTTLAAALTATGSALLADDCLPVERGTRLAWPTPYACVIKPGSRPLLSRHFLELGEEPSPRRVPRVYWLQVDNADRAPLGSGLPIETLVFPQFAKDAGLHHSRLSATEALKRLWAGGTRYDRTPAALAELIDWIESVPAYQLVYGDLETAMDWVRELTMS